MRPRPLAETDPSAIGPYRLLAELGAGGMGRVFLGYGPDGRTVAVKQVRAELAVHSGFRKRFQLEVDAACLVSGAFTAAVIDHDADAAEPWLVSQFIAGIPLREAIGVCGGTLPEASARRLAAGLASALNAIHDAGLVHRDLKPSNVLLTGDGIRVIDFGIALAVRGGENGESDDGDDGEDQRERMTGTGMVVGSPDYMSPEQAEGGDWPITSASDVFSLGSVLYAACTGGSPFADRLGSQTMYNLRDPRFAPDMGLVPRRLRSIIGRCLEQDPEARPSPAELLESLGPIGPAAQPWPEEVDREIQELRTDVDALLTDAPDVPAGRWRTRFAASLGDVVDGVQRRLRRIRSRSSTSSLSPGAGASAMPDSTGMESDGSSDSGSDSDSGSESSESESRAQLRLPRHADEQWQTIHALYVRDGRTFRIPAQEVDRLPLLGMIAENVPTGLYLSDREVEDLVSEVSDPSLSASDRQELVQGLIRNHFLVRSGTSYVRGEGRGSESSSGWRRYSWRRWSRQNRSD